MNEKYTTGDNSLSQRDKAEGTLIIHIVKLEVGQNTLIAVTQSDYYYHSN